MKKSYLYTIGLAALLALTELTGAYVTGSESIDPYDFGPRRQLDFDEDTFMYRDVPDAPLTGASYMLWDDWGGSWSDAEKVPLDDGEGNPPPNNPGEEDDLMCWAAAASNVLEWTRWGLVGEMSDTDEIFQHFQDHWYDKGSFPEYAWHWWFDGTDMPNPGGSHVDVAGGGNFVWATWQFEDYYDEEWTGSQALVAIDTFLHGGYGVTLAIYTDAGGAHAITCWGFSYDSADPDYYVGIWVTDSDDDKHLPSPPDSLRYYEIAYNSDLHGWYLQNYYGSNMWHIHGVMALQKRPRIRVVRLKTFVPLDEQLIAMQTKTAHFLPPLIRTGDIEKLDSDGCTVLSTPGFHMGHIGFNIRTDQSYRTDRPPEELSYVAAVLSDVYFRHAVIHAYDQDGILASIYRYIVTKSTSLVPPAQGGWLNPNVPQHPYNPGNPFTSPAGEHSAVGILKAGGYTFVDADHDGAVSAADYWTKAGWGGVPLPTLHLFTPTYETAPTSAEHGARIINGLKAIGLNNMEHVPSQFSPYIAKVFQNAEFDMYMAFWDLDDRFPDHLYDMTHSSQDCYPYPWRYNAPGINNAQVDAWTETVKFSLNHAQKLAAAWALQDALYNPSNPYAFAYMQLYSRVYFTAGIPELRGIVNSPGYGADNMWTWLNWHWNPGEEYVDEDGRTIVVYINGDEPESLNPIYASTVYAWNIINPTLDGLIAVTPYTHEDVPWLASDWTVTPTGPSSMEITFYLRANVEWQDGKPYTAEDAKFNWLFLRDNQIPRYTTAWEHIVDVQIITPGAGGTVKVILDETSQFLLYDLADTAALLPPQVWGWLNGKLQNQILEYDPSSNTTKPTEAGPRFGQEDGPKNQLYGTGPYIFQFYDPIDQYADVWANPHYFLAAADIPGLGSMFHEAGDVDYSGAVEIGDLSRMALSYGYFVGEPEYDPDADVNNDGVVDGKDVAKLSFSWGTKKEYP